MKIDEESCRRYAIRRAAGNYYLTITDRSIMAHKPHESDIKHATEYSLLNCCCRLASKWRGAGAEWTDIAAQMEQSGVGHSTVLDEVAAKIREEVGLSEAA